MPHVARAFSGQSISKWSLAAWLPEYEPAALTRSDWIMAAVLGVVAACLILYNHAVIDPAVYRTYNIFFQADPPRVISNLTERWSHSQNRNVAHPIFSIMGLTAVKAGGLIGIAPMKMIALLLTGAALVSVGAFFLAMRGLGMITQAGIAFTAAYMSGAAFLHWYAFPETYAASGATIAVMLAILTCARRNSIWIWIVGSTATLSMLLTNWGFGLAATIVRLRWRQFLIVSITALAAIAAVSFVQHKLLHNARFFLDPVGIAREHTFSGPQMRRLGMRWSPAASFRNALITPAIVPVAEVVHEATEAGPFTMVTNQFVPLSRLGWGGGLALACWVVLIAIGSKAAITIPRLRMIGLPLLVFIGFQAAFHTVYGEIAFLYAADTLPAMMALAALGWFTPARRIVMIAVILFIASASITNESRFLDAAAKSHEIAIAKTQGLAFGW
ncbi:MAG: hypothetical protein ACSLE1_18395 [Sphingobium sp.]